MPRISKKIKKIIFLNLRSNPIWYYVQPKVLFQSAPSFLLFDLKLGGMNISSTLETRRNRIIASFLIYALYGDGFTSYDLTLISGRPLVEWIFKHQLSENCLHNFFLLKKFKLYRVVLNEWDTNFLFFIFTILLFNFIIPWENIHSKLEWVLLLETCIIYIYMVAIETRWWG